MCVIIARDPGIILPEDKIHSACITNPDGYGISVIDRGKMETIKELTPNGNDYKTVLKRLEDAKDHKVFLHLRFKTAGAKDEVNCHPYQVLNFKDDGIDMEFMHNGTMYEFNKSDTFSDSYIFNEKILRPLIQKMKPWYDQQDDKNILGDATIYQILEKYAGSGIFTIYDSNGNSMIINEKGGKKFDGWWASNEYSFNKFHRKDNKPATWSSYAGHSSTGIYKYPDDMEGTEDTTPFEGGSSTARQLPPTTKGQGNEVRELVRGAAEVAKHVPPTIIPPEKRDTFVELAGISSLSTLTALEQQDIEDLVLHYSEAATVLIMDLLYELYLKNSKKQSGASNG